MLAYPCKSVPFKGIIHSSFNNVLGTEAASGSISFDPSQFPSPTDAATTSPSTETTKIRVRMLDGKREVINMP